MSISQIKSSFMKNKNSMVGIIKSILGFIGIYMASGIIGEIFIIIVFKCIGINIFSDVMPDNILVPTMRLLGFIFFIIGTIIYCKFIEKRSMQSMGFIKKGFIISYLKGSIIGIILILPVLLIPIYARTLTFNGINNDINLLSVILFLFGYIIQGMAEEVMCRGYLMTSLSKKASMFWAVLISSLVFTFPHLPPLFASGVQFGTIGFVNTMLFSIFVSLFMIKEMNIWIIGAIHSSWNYILEVFCGISVSGRKVNTSILIFTGNESKSLINGGIYGLEAGIITTAILIISIAVIIFTIKRKASLRSATRTVS